MIEWLAAWGVGQATWSVFRPILEKLATDVAEDAANSYVGQCFSNVYSVIHKDPLTRATGLALKELLELVESELIRAEVEDEELVSWVPDVQRFVDCGAVRNEIASLFLQPDHHLDPKTFVTAWQQLDGAHSVPEDNGFKWGYIAKRFATRVVEIRQSSSELRETFASLAKAQDSTALKELAGLPPDFNLETYREALVERHGNLDFASLDMTGAYYSEVRLWNVFVPQSARECHEYDPQLLEVPKEQLKRLADAGELDPEQLAESEKLHEERRRAYVNQPPRPVLEVVGEPTASDAGNGEATSPGSSPTLARSAHERLVILGDPGSGKSSLLRFLALRWARIDDANLRYTQPLPLLIDLRDYNRWECSSGKGFTQYLNDAQTWHRLNQQTLKHLLEQPDRVILLLDGLDEVFDPAERERVVNDIHRFSNDYKQVRIVVTSRVVGYQPHRLRNAEFRHFMLQDLDDEQIGRFLDKWHEITFDKPEEARPKQERLAKAIESSKSIAQLAGNPLLLTMMAILNRNQKLPDDRVDLYAQCSRLLLHQWDVERTLGDFPGLSDEIGLREKIDILRTVAYAMQTRLSDKSRANFIDGTTLTSLIEDYLHTELRFEQSRAIARALVEQLRTRNFILCDLGADSYAFVHRTFLEYFCAADIVHQFNVAKTLSEQELIDLFDTHCRDDDWREVLRLICGQIDEQFVGHIVEHLATRTDLETWNGETPLLELPLAIWCLGEVRNITSLESIREHLLSSAIIVLVETGWDFDLHGVLDRFLKDLLSAIEAVVSPWPGESQVHSCAVSKLNSIHGAGINYWVEFVAAIDSTPASLQSLATADDRQNSGFIRSRAINALAKKWPDETTRDFLVQRAVHDTDKVARQAAVHRFVENWPSETTREVLTGWAIDARDDDVRAEAIRMLAENWLDESTRALLTNWAVDAPHYDVRREAILMLAKNWPDDITRQLLTERSVQDESTAPRFRALEALAKNWPDDTTRQLLTERSVQDESDLPRYVALQVLAENWPDERTREMLVQRVLQDPSFSVRYVAATESGGLHSEFGRTLWTKSKWSAWSYDEQYDVLEPIPRWRIEGAAKKVGIAPEDIDAQVALLSAHLGWDITRGPRAS